MAKKKEAIPVVAAFDFDGTITDRDSFPPFLVATFGRPRVLFGLLRKLPFLFGFVVGLTSRKQVKEELLRTFFGEMPHDTLCQHAEAFAKGALNKIVKNEAMERLSWHQKQGHHCVLISASIETYLRPWGKKEGFHDVIASQLELSPEGLVTGKLKGENCWGPEKVRRLEERLGPKESFILYAYGDSEGDRALLSIADHPFYQMMPS